MLSDQQFKRLDEAKALAAGRTEEQKVAARLAGYTARRQAARSDATHWALTVDHSSHADLRRGITQRSQSHVLLSKDEFPNPLHAEAEAYLGMSERDTFPTKVRHAT